MFSYMMAYRINRFYHYGLALWEIDVYKIYICSLKWIYRYGLTRASRKKVNRIATRKTTQPRIHSFQSRYFYLDG